MSVWRYRAMPARGGRAMTGVVSAPTLPDARDDLRRAGMRVIRIRAASAGGGRAGRLSEMVNSHLRRRRSAVKAEAFDALATLVRSGITPLRALRVLAGSHAKTSGIALLARTIGDDVAEGVAFSEAARRAPGWFDAAECAMLRAGERAGELDAALTRLAERQARSSDLGARLAGVMLYPLIVTVIGVGVAVYLSVWTLPQLAGVLEDAGIEVPALTVWVMTVGSVIADHTVPVGAGLAALVGLMALLCGKRALPGWAVRWWPSVFRRVRTAESFLALSALTESGLTLVESVRVVAPTVGGPIGSALSRAWVRVAERVEQGAAFESAIDDPAWFTEEHRALLAAGARAGALSETLRRLGERDRRSANRLIDRAAGLLEPASIVLLTVFVGTIVLAAVLPIVRLQEII